MRTKDQIDRDYAETCTKAGDLQYRILRYKKELERTNIALRQIEQEFSDLTRAPTEDLEYAQRPEDTKTP